ncbi:uncharacterized protein LOC126320773 [Schistocerca gregaria]|uniref:uncharacterized protein LOC126320773 n=1 Tax=Schistocerca gregaria TaxID=7010 RepID=UPI00211ED438|nr:uncharacterized protein LOC126320773 [Schistocerca gregaria]
MNSDISYEDQPVPTQDHFNLESIVNNLPRELFQKSVAKTLRRLLFTFILMTVGYTLLTFIPWYCLPFIWAVIGCCFTAMYAISYDCLRGSFSSFPKLNSVIGTLVSLPLLMPYDSWRIQEFYKYKSVDTNHFESIVAGKLALFTASVRNWLSTNFTNLPKIWRPGNRLRIVLSFVWLHLFSAVFFTSLLLMLGVWGFAKFWLFPWVMYHIWMAGFYSYAYRVPFRDGMSIRFSISFPAKVPKWISFLTNDICYVISVSTPFISDGMELIRRKVPNYNLGETFEMMSNLLNKKLQESGAISYLDEVSPTVTSPPIADAKESTTMFSSLLLFAKKVNWIPALWLLSSPLIALYGLATTPVHSKTVWASVVMYMLSGLGITVGYHRYFSHRAFNANPFMRLMLLICGTSAFQGSCIWWAHGHRAHHRYVDTDKDPYNSRRGFFWSHIGWLLVKQDKSCIGKVDDSDLRQDPLLIFQDRYYLPLSITMSLLVPWLIAGFGWGDWRGGFYYVFILRSVLVSQSTFCINSLAHSVGSFTFSDAHTPRDCYWVSFLTFGEGYHNFHHEFPYDYRNGVFFFSFDPSKWLIWFFSLFNITYNLKRCPTNEIEKGRLQMLQKRTVEALKQLYWGPLDDELPYFTPKDVKDRVAEGSNLVIIDGAVYDVSHFLPNHPGGEAILKSYLGKDATKAFRGGVYNHSNYANNLLCNFKVGLLRTKSD